MAATPGDPLPGALTTTFWGSLRTPDRAVLLGAGVVQRVRRGARLCREGQRPGRVWVLYSGRAEVVRHGPGGHRSVLAVRGAGDVIGELSAVDDRPMSATVMMLDEGGALVLSAAAFAEACRERPSVGWVVMTVVAARLRHSDVHRTQQWADVRQRTILALLELAAPLTATPSAGGPVTIRITQQDLADLVAASLVSVTRVLEDLRLSGAVRTSRGRIVLSGPDALKSLLPSDA